MDDPDLQRAAELAFARLEAEGGDPRRLPVAPRTVATVYAAQGVIDNGGLRRFFENDWPSRPPYAVFVEAFRAVGADAEADAIAEVVEAFGVQAPEAETAYRAEFLRGPGGDHVRRLDTRLVSDVWNLLAAYARRNRDSFDA